MLFMIKVFISGFVIAFASWLSERKPLLAGFIVALPITSALTILLAYLEHRDMDKINQFCLSCIVSVPLSLTFFIPFLLNRWLKMTFVLTYSLALACLGVCYLIHGMILKAR